MIYTSIKYLRIGSVVMGSLLLIVSIFLPYYSSCKWNSDESGTIPFSIYGYAYNGYWIQFFFTLAAFVSGYFYRDIANKALLYTFTIMLMIFLFFTLNIPSFGGSPCIRSTEIGGAFTLFGSFLILLGTFISIYREEA
jgi:hypothetical protein